MARYKDFNYFARGTCNTIDDVTGFKTKFTKVKLRWDGFRVALYNWEERQPQDFQVTPRPPAVYSESKFEQVEADTPPPLTQFY